MNFIFIKVGIGSRNLIVRIKKYRLQEQQKPFVFVHFSAWASLENNVNKRVSAHPVIYVFLIFPIICKVPSQCDNPFFCLDEFKGSADFETNVSVSPYSWYHVCLGLDTVSGLLRIIMNGHMVQNEEKEFFRGTDSIRPKSLAGKLGGKIESWWPFGIEYWYCIYNIQVDSNMF